jgi:hypothetical protein
MSGNGIGDGPKLTVVGKEAGRAELERAEAARATPEFITKNAIFQGQVSHSPGGPIWAVGFTLPEGMAKRPIKVLVEQRSGRFHLFGEVPNPEYKQPDEDAASSVECGHVWAEISTHGDLPTRKFLCTVCNAVRWEGARAVDGAGP